MEISLVFQDHPDDHMWDQYALGHLTDGQLSAVEEHLLICERCQNALADNDRYVRLMKAGSARFSQPTTASHRGRVLPFVGGSRLAKLGSTGTIAAACVLALLWFASPLLVHRTNSVEGAAPVVLQSLRGGAAMNRAPAGRPLDLSISTLDAPPSGRCRIEVLTGHGDTVWSGMAEAGRGELHILTGKALSKGDYWVRLFGPSSELLAEYGLKVE